MSRVYAAYNRNPSVVEKSSSGGMFTALSDGILSRNGKIIGGGYNYVSHKLEHVVCSTPEERDLCRGSKYFQSTISGSVYDTLTDCISKNVPVLFFGMPCQVAAVNRFVAIKQLPTEQLFTCDILCHGVGSPGMWNCFITWKNTSTNFVTFKDKRKGWKNPLCIARDGNKEFSIRGYSWLYFSNLILRPSCYECQYTRTNREGDFTIGDFWKVQTKAPDMYNPRGTSFIMVNSEKGKELFETIKQDLVYKEIDLESIMQNSLQHPVKRPDRRTNVMADFDGMKAGAFFRKWELKLFAEKIVNSFSR